MAWFKVDDGLHSSRKFLSIPKRARFAAIGLWTVAGSWCADELTDGHVPNYMLDVWGAPPSAPQSLVDAGLWERESGGYVIYNWLEYQPRKADVDAEREASRDRMRELRARRKQQKPRNDAEVEDMFDRTGANCSENVRNPDPTRPIYKEINKENGDVIEVTDVPDGTRSPQPLPNPFMLTDEMKKWAAEKTPGLDPVVETEDFVKYWRHGEGKGKKKKNWVLTWQRRMKQRFDWLPAAERGPQKKVRKF